MPILKCRVTYRNTKGKPGFKDVLLSQVPATIEALEAKGYTMIQANPPYEGR
jgi:hypothetical protein